jgi:hypothetical protein
MYKARPSLFCLQSDRWLPKIRRTTVPPFWKLTVRCRVFLEKLLVPHLLNKFPSCYCKRMSITSFTTVGYWFLNRARGIQSRPYHYISLTSILILFFHLRLNLRKSPHYFSFAKPNTFLWSNWFLGFFYCSKNKITTIKIAAFRKLVLLPSSGEKRWEGRNT